MAKILITDDEQDIQNLIKGFAQREGHEIKCASSGNEALELCKTEDFDLIIMDVMMDDMDGFTATKEIKKIKDIPILMLTALGAEYDKLHGFDLGIEDYVTKPFSPRELMARINVILRRNEKLSHGLEKDDVFSDGQNASLSESDFLSVGRLCINEKSHDVFISGEKIDLSAKEFELLLYFCKNKNRR